MFPMLHDALTLAIAESRAESGDVQLDEAKLRAGYICRPCFRAFEKLHKLKEQIPKTFKPKCQDSLAIFAYSAFV